MAKVLEIKQLNAGYKKSGNVVRLIDIVIEENESMGLFGTNGAGKSTILKAIMGLLYQQEGHILFYPPGSTAPVDITNFSSYKRARLGIKYLTQDAQVFPSFTVRENLLFACNYQKHLLEERIQYLLQLFPELEHREFLDKKGNELSGGERAKTAISMVLISQPRLLMLDEPSAGLAPNVVGRFLKGIRELQKNQSPGMGIILIEQQKLLDAKNICDTICLLKNGETTGLDGKPARQKLKALCVTDGQLEEFMLGEG